MAEPQLEPISVRIATAVTLTGLCRTKIYELIDTGEIEAVKVGRSRLLLFRSLRKLIDQRAVGSSEEISHSGLTETGKT